MATINALEVIQKLEYVKESKAVLSAIAVENCQNEKFSTVLHKVLAHSDECPTPSDKSVEIQLSQALRQLEDYAQVLEEILRSMKSEWPPKF